MKNSSSFLTSILMLLSVFVLSVSSVSAYNLTDRDTTIIKQYMTIIESRLSGKPASEWQRIGDLLNKKIQALTQTDSRKYVVYSELASQIYNEGTIHLLEEKLASKQKLLADVQAKYNSPSLSTSDKQKLKTYIDTLNTAITNLKSNIELLQGDK